MNSMAGIEGDPQDLLGFRDQNRVNWAAEEMDPKEPGATPRPSGDKLIIMIKETFFKDKIVNALFYLTIRGFIFQYLC